MAPDDEEWLFALVLDLRSVWDFPTIASSVMVFIDVPALVAAQLRSGLGRAWLEMYEDPWWSAADSYAVRWELQCQRSMHTGRWEHHRSRSRTAAEKTERPPAKEQAPVGRIHCSETGSLRRTIQSGARRQLRARKTFSVPVAELSQVPFFWSHFL